MTTNRWRWVMVAAVVGGVGPGHAVETVPLVPVSIKVEVAKTPKARGHRGAEGTGEERFLILTLKNSGRPVLTDLELKYWLLIRDVQSKEIAVGIDDSTTVTIPAFGTLVVTSVVVKCDYAPQSEETGRAAGAKFYGYGVQVSAAGKVAAQVYEPVEARKSIEAQPAEPPRQAALASRKETPRTEPVSDKQWGRNYDDALLQAKKDKKLVIVDIFTDWCGWCRKLDREVYTDKDVQQKLKDSFVPVKINPEKSAKNAKLAGDFGNTGYPHIVVVDAEGKKVGELGGYVPAVEFLEFLRQMATAHGGG